MNQFYWTCKTCNELNMDDGDIMPTVTCNWCGTPYLLEEIPEWVNLPPDEEEYDGGRR